MRELGALVLVAVAAAVQLPLAGWNAGAHYALVQSLADGTPRIDRHLNQSGDIAWVDGHYYAAKSPGLAFFSLPVYLAFDAAGAVPATGLPQPGQGPPGGRHVWPRAIWQVNLVVVVAFLVLLVLVRRVADSLYPGSGTQVALMLGLGTMLLPFATAYFSHVLSATLGFAAFVAARRGLASGRAGPVALAGLLAGLAVFTELPLAIVAACVFAYVAARARPRRLVAPAAYAGGFLVGVLPLALYDVWAFGSPFETGYANAVQELGASGHDVIGANGSGFFGLGRPQPHAAWELLFSQKGLFVLTPIALAAVLALVLLWRDGHRSEAVLVGGTAVAMLVYNASYYLPFGGGTPGPRFLVPLLPFLALPLAAAASRWPTATAAVAAVSAFWMVVATVAGPLIPEDASPTSWLTAILHDREEPGSLVGGGPSGVVCFAAPLALALALVVRPPPWARRRRRRGSGHDAVRA